MTANKKGNTYSCICCLQLCNPIQSCCSNNLCLEQKWPSQNPQSPTPLRGAELQDLKEHRFRLFFTGVCVVVFSFVDTSDLLSEAEGDAKYKSELSVIL